MNKLPLASWLLAGLALAGPRAARAQTQPDPVYTYVEQMPALPGGSGGETILVAILERLRVPTEATAAQRAGTVVVRFVVTPTGEVTGATIAKGVSPALDAAVLAAVAQLPRFTPGKQNGRPVRVAETIPVKLAAATAAIPATAAPRPAGETYPNDSLKVYSYAEKSPELPGGGGMAAIVAAVRQRLVVPPGTPPGQVFVVFTVGPSGTVYDPKIKKALSMEADAAALAAVRRLPRFVPASQNGRNVAFSFTVPVNFFAADRK